MNLEGLEVWIKDIAQQVPIELFTAGGGFIEEIIAPIPSPLVMTVAGAMAEVQHHALPYLLWLAFLGAVGKTLGSWIIFYAATKAETLIVVKFGAFFGVDMKQIDALSERLNKGWKDDVLLTFLRALPFMPSSLLSVACGLLKIRIRTFLMSTFIGNLIRNYIFLYFGFAGTEAYGSVMQGFDNLESVLKVVMLLAMAGGIAWVYLKRKK